MNSRLKNILIALVFIFFIALIIDLSFITITTAKKYRLFGFYEEAGLDDSEIAAPPKEIKEIDLNLSSNMSEIIYIAPYVGDIDGDVSDDWLYFYGKLADFHNNNQISSAFSFYPGTMRDDGKFKQVFLKMYHSKYIELVQKGYIGDEKEMIMDTLSFEEQENIIKKGQDEFKKKIQKMTNNNEIKMPRAYNQIEGNIYMTSVKILESLGFNF